MIEKKVADFSKGGLKMPKLDFQKIIETRKDEKEAMGRNVPRLLELVKEKPAMAQIAREGSSDDHEWGTESIHDFVLRLRGYGEI
jgi:hypothetical protein